MSHVFIGPTELFLEAFGATDADSHVKDWRWYWYIRGKVILKSHWR